MDPQLESLIRKAFANAWAEGADPKTATKRAVGEVLQERPDMTISDAVKAVQLVQQK